MSNNTQQQLAKAQASVCAESERQCAAAWAKVVEVLDEVAPDWLEPDLNGDKCAVLAIRKLAAEAHPLGDVVRDNIDAQTDRVRERTAVAQLVADDEPIETTTGNSVTYDPPSFQYVERPPMTLNEIVAAVRTNELVTGRDMRYAIVAFDVLMSQLHVDQHVAQLQEYFKAATAVPREYAGHMNDPENPEAVEWFKAMQEVSGS